jgi:hypothetical protein
LLTRLHVELVEEEIERVVLGVGEAVDEGGGLLECADLEGESAQLELALQLPACGRRRRRH